MGFYDILRIQACQPLKRKTSFLTKRKISLSLPIMIFHHFMQCLLKRREKNRKDAQLDRQIFLSVISLSHAKLCAIYCFLMTVQYENGEKKIYCQRKEGAKKCECENVIVEAWEENMKERYLA